MQLSQLHGQLAPLDPFKELIVGLIVGVMLFLVIKRAYGSFKKIKSESLFEQQKRACVDPLLKTRRYVIDLRNSGYSNEDIRAMLKESNYSDDIIDDAMS